MNIACDLNGKETAPGAILRNQRQSRPLLTPQGPLRQSRSNRFSESQRAVTHAMYQLQLPFILLTEILFVKVPSAPFASVATVLR